MRVHVEPGRAHWGLRLRKRWSRLQADRLGGGGDCQVPCCKRLVCQRTQFERAGFANHHPGVSLIAQQRETGHAIVVGGSWVRAGTWRYLLSRHRYTTLLKAAAYRVGMAPISQYGFLIASLTRGERSGMCPCSCPQHRRSSGFGGLCSPSSVGVLQDQGLAGLAGVNCSNWGWGNGSQLDQIRPPDAPTHEPALLPISFAACGQRHL